MAATAPGSILMKIDHFSIKIQLRNGVQNSRLDFDSIWWFSIKNQLRNLFQTSGSIFLNIDDFSIKNQLRNGLQSPSLDFDQKW